jgi:DNA-binding MarR family transcriptional regulator
MSEAYGKRQHVVNTAKRPARTPAGDAFTHLVVEVATLGGIFTAAGESLARLADQSLARWVVLESVADEPATVAQVARGRGIARQAVQRVADLLVDDGLAMYLPNPADRRAQLLEPTPHGRDALRVISVAQKDWADRLGAELGELKLQRLASEISAVREAVSAYTPPGVPGRRRPSPRAVLK